MEDHAIQKAIEEGIKNAFSVGQENQRFIDVQRIPLICQSIVSIDERLKSIDDKMVTKERFVLVERMVYGAAVTILLAVLGALVTLVIK